MLAIDNAVLMVIDFQTGLLPKIQNADGLLPRAIKLIRVVRELGIPILWTEQYPKGLGPTDERVANELSGLRPIDKVSFGCFGAPAFEEALRGLGRRQLLVTGVEAHVCVMQTVLSALAQGFETFVVQDATGSRSALDCECGLARMRDHGATLVTSEMAIFEMLRAAGTPEFKKVLPLIKQ
jgi:nicotinamidase-related amidase